MTAPRSDALVMFGLTGDLGHKKLLPAIYDLAVDGRLDIPVIGVGRSEHSDADLRSMLDEALADYEPAGGDPIDAAVVSSIDLTYLRGDSTETDVYDALAERLDGCRDPLLYAALPPSIFGSVARGIAASSLPPTTRLVVEKPFGDSAESARDLYDEITAELPADQLFIVDHFLAKAAIENILTVRTVNPLLDAVLDADHVDAVDVVMSETGGVDGRGSFYEGVGAIKDVVQNHMLQLLAMATMEPPADDSDDALHHARSALLEQIAPVGLGDVVLGQYDGYRELGDVADDSTVETFVSLGLTIDDPRWKGVPITLRTGKQLATDLTEVVFHLKNVGPHSTRNGNRVRFTVKPSPSVSFDLDVIDPESHGHRPTTVFACGPVDHGSLGDYAVMFDNAMSGDDHHFAQIDGIIAAWRILEPLLTADLALDTYTPGSDGPT
ncbi:MAG: glucose-6-phosphate dehydrogenase [Ilumatobacteraceae bacterium]